MTKLDLVIVTYNRLEKLKKALLCYEQQTASFRNLIVVNNCSTDGTKDYLDEWKQQKTPFQKVVIHSNENLGGSGGFYLGQKKALELGADWVFVADDDAYATPTMVEEFYRFVKGRDCTKISAVCAAVRRLDGCIDACHRDRYRIVKGKRWPCMVFNRMQVSEEEYNKDFFSIDLLSYVGSFINSQAMMKYGVVNPRYFIFFDDSEHSLRLKKYGEILVVPRIRILHEGGQVESNEPTLSWRNYYLKRNETHMLLKHYPRTAIYTIYTELRRIIGRKIYGRPLNPYELLNADAVMDALFGRLGKHSIYRPGVQVTVEK